MKTLEAKELYRFFHAGEDEVKALRGVDLDLKEGEMIALVGPSGSGKSTLLMCLAGLDEPDGGSVHVLDKMMTRKTEAEKTRLRSSHLGVMLQKNNLFAHLTVLENVLAVQAVGGERDQAVSLGILSKIGLESRAHSLPAQLSGGERARAGLAAAMARKPEILLLDEPTGEVDAVTEQQILAVLQSHRHGGGCVVVATHNPAVAKMADRVLSMKDGRIVNV
jgi:putative ABC transport system ATP-binding protein